ncbi:MAG TPA: beta-ketoacyl synthase N-terminal-like domain-containing protein [Bacteroidia bacterium]|nr:beta-ketoacyl synthase N-terminal-like domain-containing protein [Bacteroidia bacterium]
MLKQVFVVADNIFSPLGYNTDENLAALQMGKTAVRQHQNFRSSGQTVVASLFENNVEERLIHDNTFSLFEKILIASIQDALQNATIQSDDAKTIVIISSTKGNISAVENGINREALAEQTSLINSATKISAWFRNSNKPVVVSNACISGLAALGVGKRLIQSGKYDHAIVAGADLITRFIQSGFDSFQALSNEVCKPFDRKRNGINLGEAAATVILSKHPGQKNISTTISGLSVSNDANHISGPSRTGEELALAIQRAMQEASVSPEDVGFLSAHGTATVYNDEMEAKAFRLSGLTQVPMNSMKGYYGHTLGAAGLLEAIVTIRSILGHTVFPSYGFEESGVSVDLNICQSLLQTEILHAVKTASGFGGCNAAMVISKNKTA